MKHLRLGQAQPDRAQTQRGIGRHAFRGVDLLVRAEVVGADGDRQAVHFLDHLAVGLELLVLVGQVAAVQEQELAAEQADAVGAVLPGAGDIVGQLDVGVQFDLRAVERVARVFLSRLSFCALELPLFAGAACTRPAPSCRDRR